MILIDNQPISIAPGTRQFEAAIDAPGKILVRLARKTTATPTLWADGVNVAFNIKISDDSGTTWRDLCGFTAKGGIYTGKNGEEAETWVLCPFPSTSNRAQMTATISGNTLVSLLSVERV